MPRIPDASVDPLKNKSLLRKLELGIPVVAMVDTNTDQTISMAIYPANDDAIRAVKN